MGRKQDRKAAERETNADAELCKVQRKYVPELFDLFKATADSRIPGYIICTNRMMPGQMFSKGLQELSVCRDFYVSTAHS